MAVDETDRIVSFLEKPKEPPGMPDNPDMALASMGIYVFATAFSSMNSGATRPIRASRDFGKDIIPYLVKHGKAVAHRFTRSCVRSATEAEAYWRDVGTLDAYWAANIDLTGPLPALDLYDREWPIWTFAEVTRPQSSFMTVKIGEAWRPTRSCPAAASSRARPCAGPFCSRMSACTPMPTSTMPSSSQAPISPVLRASRRSSSTAACAFPRGW